MFFLNDAFVFIKTMVSIIIIGVMMIMIVYLSYIFIPLVILGIIGFGLYHYFKSTRSY